MKITTQRLKEIIQEEIHSDERIVSAIRDLSSDLKNTSLNRAIDKLIDRIDDLDLSVDFLSAAVLDVDPLSISGAQAALGRSANPQGSMSLKKPPAEVEEAIRQELEAVLSETSGYYGGNLTIDDVQEVLPHLSSGEQTDIWEKYKHLNNQDELRKALRMNEEDDWIQKAVDPDHEGYCTPMTKPTCTPKRKALAKRFKKAAKKKDREGGTGWQGKV